MRRDYGPDVLAEGAGRRRRAEFPQVPAERGLVVEEAGGGFCGAVVDCQKQVVTLEDRFGRQRVFPLSGGGFLLEGRPVTLIRPRQPGPPAPERTASGSVAAPRAAAGTATRARVARASRIYVEGRQDADLVEKIWGDDLREVGVVVEYLAGVDHLPSIVAGFAPGPARSLGIGAWPAVPRETPWKEGVMQALGWGGDTAAGWRRVLSAASSYADLEPALLGRVEELIDFVTAPGTGDPAAAVEDRRPAARP